jgi:hypothetical protein
MLEFFVRTGTTAAAATTAAVPMLMLLMLAHVYVSIRNVYKSFTYIYMYTLLEKSISIKLKFRDVCCYCNCQHLINV